MPDKFLILTALTLEAKALEPLVAANWNTQLSVIGMRAVRLTDQLIRSAKPDRIILAGLAGGLDPSLKVGDIVVDQAAADSWPKLTYRYGRIHSSGNLISTPAEKATLFAQTSALAVDMESAPVRSLASGLGIPVLTIRVISDSATDEISPELLACVDELGNPRPAALIGKLAMNLTIIPSLMRLGRNSRLACEKLSEAVGDLLRHSPK